MVKDISIQLRLFSSLNASFSDGLQIRLKWNIQSLTISHLFWNIKFFLRIEANRNESILYEYILFHKDAIFEGWPWVRSTKDSQYNLWIANA